MRARQFAWFVLVLLPSDPLSAPRAAAASLLNGVLSQSIGAAANQCFKLPPWLLHYTLHLPPHSLSPYLPELAMFLIEKRFFNYVSQLLFGAAAPTASGWLPCCVPFNLLFLLPFRYPWGLAKGLTGMLYGKKWWNNVQKYSKNNYLQLKY